MDNLLIEGDNLRVMRELLVDYEGKIDVMPIDPPYNTNIDKIGYKDVYEDGTSEESWGVFMKERLELAYRLLSDKGVMFIHIDENEVCNLLTLCSRIFGNHHVKHAIWKKTNEHFDTNRQEKPLENGIRRTHEYVVICFKNPENTNLKDIVYPVWEGGVCKEVRKPLETVIDNLGTTSSAKDEIKELFDGELFFPTPKPVKLIKEFIRSAANKTSIVMDFFAGSGTTGHAVMDLNKEDGGQRKYILINNSESNIFENVTVRRIKKAIEVHNYHEDFRIGL